MRKLFTLIALILVLAMMPFALFSCNETLKKPDTSQDDEVEDDGKGSETKKPDKNNKGDKNDKNDKKFKTKEISKQINSARLSFAPPEYMEEYLDITGAITHIYCGCRMCNLSLKRIRSIGYKTTRVIPSLISRKLSLNGII